MSYACKLKSPGSDSVVFTACFDPAAEQFMGNSVIVFRTVPRHFQQAGAIYQSPELISIKGSIVERGGRLAVRVVVRVQDKMNNNTQLKGDR